MRLLADVWIGLRHSERDLFGLHRVRVSSVGGILLGLDIGQQVNCRIVVEFLRAQIVTHRLQLAPFDLVAKLIALLGQLGKLVVVSGSQAPWLLFDECFLDLGYVIYHSPVSASDGIECQVRYFRLKENPGMFLLPVLPLKSL